VSFPTAPAVGYDLVRTGDMPDRTNRGDS